MEQISVLMEECRKVGASAGEPVVVGDLVRHEDRLWRVVGTYVVFDPTTGDSREYCVLSLLGNGNASEPERA